MQEIFYKIVMNSENSVATPPPSSSSSFATNSPYNHIISIKNTRRSDRLTRSKPPSHREIYYQQYLNGQVRCHRDGVPRGHLGRGRRPSRRGRGAADSQGHAMPARGAGKPARRVPAGTAAAADRPHGHRVRLVPVDHRAANAVLPAAPGREPRVPLRRHPPHGEGIRADHATSGRRRQRRGKTVLAARIGLLGRVRWRDGVATAAGRRRAGRTRMWLRLRSADKRPAAGHHPREAGQGTAVVRGATADDVQHRAPGVQRLLRRRH
jgi:hypothetical protein